MNMYVSCEKLYRTIESLYEAIIESMILITNFYNMYKKYR